MNVGLPTICTQYSKYMKVSVQVYNKKVLPKKKNIVVKPECKNIFCSPSVKNVILLLVLLMIKNHGSFVNGTLIKFVNV